MHPLTSLSGDVALFGDPFSVPNYTVDFWLGVGMSGSITYVQLTGYTYCQVTLGSCSESVYALEVCKVSKWAWAMSGKEPPCAAFWRE